VFLLAAVAVAEAPFVALWVESRAMVTASHGTVYVETDPSGAEVLVNGKVAGRTPARLLIPRGKADIELRRAGTVRALPLTIVPEEVVRLRVELPTNSGGSPEPGGSSLDIPEDVFADPAGIDSVAAEGGPPTMSDSSEVALAQLPVR
jgi:hypothetical protein